VEGADWLILIQAQAGRLVMHLKDLRMLPLFAFCACTCAWGTTRMTGLQLEQALTGFTGQPDAAVARQLLEIQPAERFDPATLSHCNALVPGSLSRQALTALADESFFLESPASALPKDPAPDRAAQARIITSTVSYVTNTVHQLPNFFATRVTTSFQNNPFFEKSETSGHSAEQDFNSNEPLHPVGKYVADVLYRHGSEVIRGQVSGPQGLTTSGEFGPVLGTVLLDAASGKLAWSHWERDGGSRLAVFHFSVAADKSHFDVGFCCILRGHGEAPSAFHQFTAYDGELWIDPATGAILRLSLTAIGLKRSDPIVQARILVKYGPVELGGRTYICPLKGVALSVGLEVRPTEGPLAANAPLQTLLNDVAFEQYHVSRADVKILP
jgi:hypothetical protein